MKGHSLIVVIVAMKILVSLCILNRHKLQKDRELTNMPQKVESITRPDQPNYTKKTT